MRAANRLLARLGKTEEAHLPLPHEVRHGADDVLDRHCGIDAVLIEQVDVIRLQPAQRAFDRFADVCRPAVHSAMPPFSSNLKPNLVAMTTRSRETLRCLRARANNSSFAYGPYASAVSKNVTPELNRAANRRDGFALVAFFGGAVRLAHPHQAESERRNREALRAEFALGQHYRTLGLGSYCSSLTFSIQSTVLPLSVS